MNTNKEDTQIIDVKAREVVEHPEYVLDAIETLNLPHPDYDG